MSTNHCARTYFWWVHVHLTFGSCTYPTDTFHFNLKQPGMWAVYNFERLRFCSLLTSSQESVKQKSTFTFTFTFRTIYEVNDTAAWVLWVVLFNRVSSHLTSITPHYPHPSISIFVWGYLNSFSSHFSFIWSIHPSMDWSIDGWIVILTIAKYQALEIVYHIHAGDVEGVVGETKSVSWGGARTKG